MATDQFNWEILKPQSHQAPQQWEFTSFYHDSDDDPSDVLNEFGNAGWRLVAALPCHGHLVRCYLMREKV